MDVLKKIGNIFGILFAFVLSVALMVVLIAIPIVSAASSFTQGETLHQVMAEIDYSQVITAAVVNSDVVNTEDVVTVGPEQGVSSDILEDIMNTEAVGEVLDLYMEDAFAALEGGGEISLTPEALQEIAGEHMDELIGVAKEFLGEDVEMTDEQVSEFVSQTVEEHADTIIEMLPPVEEMLPIRQDAASIQQEENTDVTQMLVDALISLRNGTSVMAVIIVAVIISVLILLCRITRLKGFMWLGVVYLISAGLALIGSSVMGGSKVVELLDMGAAGEVVGPIFSILASKMRESTFMIAICAAVFILIFAVGRFILKSKTIKADA
uniref:hypothetical protein n=1 Tax=Acetatifactor sp. TaxID=1872090 RepID=UPI004057906E